MTVLAASGAAIGWTITGVLTFLLIVLPALYLLVLTLIDDDGGFERRVHDAERAVSHRR